MPVNQALEILKKAAINIIDLKLSQKEVKDSDLSIIASFSNLENLWLDNNALTDNGFKKLTVLNHLEYLNASETELTPAALQELTAIKTLRKVIAVNTKVNEADKQKFQLSAPDLKLILPDSMQRFASDTIFSIKTN
jgi:Leucine-rich repeat (LRR) protein